jgi:hypothetical protein
MSVKNRIALRLAQLCLTSLLSGRMASKGHESYSNSDHAVFGYQTDTAQTGDTGLLRELIPAPFTEITR